MPLISIVVPVYKVEDYLDRCVDSILTQTLSSFDLILVDDGSPDSCGEICDTYAAKDNRIIVIHQTNQGLSEARNTGIDWAIKNSNSEWMTFIDSDDWIHPEYLRLLYESAIRNNVDLSICNCAKTSDYSVKSFIPDEEVKLFTPEDFWCFRQYGGAWAKLYKKTHFKDIRYPKGLLYEDIYVTYRLIFMQTKLVYLEDPLYYYYIRNDSITKSKWDPRYLSQIDGEKQQIKFFKENHYDQAYVVTIKKFLYSINTQYNTVKEAKDLYFKYYVKLKIMFKFYLLKYHRFVPVKNNTNLYRAGLPMYTALYKKYTHILEFKNKG